MNPNRRNFLQGKMSSNTEHIRPPWLLGDPPLTERCSHCSDCVTACPESILLLDPDGLPHINFSLGECSFCGECAHACPEQLFDTTDKPPWDLKAHINEHCLTEQAVICQSCKDSCPNDAISLRLAVGQVPTPVIDTTACTGCGGCIEPCPSQAINLLEPAQPTFKPKPINTDKELNHAC